MSQLTNLVRNNSQKGASTIYIVILLVVIIMAVMLSGGPSRLTTGDLATTVTEPPTPTTAPTVAPTATPSAIPTTAPSSPSSNTAWSVEFSFLGCNVDGLPRGEVRATGQSNGYLNLEIQTGGSFDEISTNNFISPESIVRATLPNSKGFNQNSWRLNLYSGGNLINGRWAGGALQETYNGSPTGC